MTQQLQPLEYQTPPHLAADGGSGAAARYSSTPKPWLKVLWPVLGLALLFLADLLFIPHFFQMGVVEGRLTGSLPDIFKLAGPDVLLATGMTLVLATGGVDLSVGAVMALVGGLIAELSANRGWPIGGAIAAALGASVLCGAWNGALVTMLEIQPIVATLVLMVAGRGIATKVSGAAHIDVAGGPIDVLRGALLYIPTEGLVGFAILALTAAFCRRTSAGLLIEATGGNPVASRYAGVNVKRVTFLSYVFSALCAGLAGLLATAEVRGADASQMGLFKELDAILAAVIGGTALTGGRFSLAGAAVGALLIVTLNRTIQSSSIPSEYTQVIKAVVVLAVCLLQSESFRAKIVNALKRFGALGRE